jgi:hypothetical protein
LVIAACTVGYFIDQSDKTFDKTGVFRQLIIDSGFYGREEFFLFATGIGFFIAILSLIIGIASLQDKAHWAASVSLQNNCSVSDRDVESINIGGGYHYVLTNFF